jgi:hypothetical protein
MDPRQGELFPLDCTARPKPALSLFRPYPGIQRAVVAPPDVAHTAVLTPDDRVSYLLVGEDGHSVLQGVTTLAQLKDGDGWALLAKGLFETNSFDVRLDAPDIGPPPDCWETWFSPGPWQMDCSTGRPHPLVRSLTEQNKHLVTSLRTGRLSDELACLERAIAEQLLSKAVAPLVEWALGGLDPTLAATLASRPRLGLHAAVRLLVGARAYGSDAERFAIQFMRTEPIGLIRLLAFAEHASEADAVRQALFTGQSLKQHLHNLGVGRAVHRRLRRKFNPDTDPSELPLSGPQWLELTRMLSEWPSSEWPTMHSEWIELLGLCSIKQSRQASMKTLSWAWRPGGESLRRWRILDQAAIRIQSLAKKPVRNFQTTEAVRDLIVTTSPELKEWSLDALASAFSSANLGLYADLICQVEGSDLEWAMQEVFSNINHSSLTMRHWGYEFTLIASWNDILRHGRRAGNCLAKPRYAANYCLVPGILFVLTESTGVSHTVGAKFQEVAVDTWALSLAEIRANKNQSTPAAVVDMAEEFLASLNSALPDSFARHRIRFKGWRSRIAPD